MRKQNCALCGKPVDWVQAIPSEAVGVALRMRYRTDISGYKISCGCIYIGWEHDSEIGTYDDGREISTFTLRPPVGQEQLKPLVFVSYTESTGCICGCED